MKSIEIVPLLQDNYSYLIRYGKKAFVVDPSESGLIAQKLQKKSSTLSHILVTHSHADHVGGVPELAKRYGASVIGPKDPKIPCLDHPLDDGERVIIGPYCVRALSTPGHSSAHLAFLLEEERILFTGDLLFGCGAGKLEEDSQDCAHTMWSSLEKILAFEEDTQIYPGHEYTKQNLSFAAHLEKENPWLNERALSLEKKSAKLVPTTVGLEKKTNPFLRANRIEMQRLVAQETATPGDVLWEIRKRKNRFS